MSPQPSIAPFLPAILSHADSEDTSLLITELATLKSRLDLLAEAFPGGTRHAVVIKTNPHKALLKVILQNGFDLEAASMEEVDLAIDAGAKPENIIFDSPVKTRSEILKCASLIGMLVNANSLEELNRFPENVLCELGIRVNPGIDTGSPDIFDVSTDESKFGVPVDTEASIVEACLQYPVTALHMHSGSQMKNLDGQIGAIRRLLRLADSIDDKLAKHGLDRKITTINIGGGLPAEDDLQQPLMRQYAESVCAIVAQSSVRRQLRTEFGQWTHRAAGSAICKVEYLVDGPIPTIFTHLGADYFTRHIYAPQSRLNLHVLDSDGREKRGTTCRYNIAGPLCFAGDYLARDIELPVVEEGNWLLIPNTGANTYGLWSRHCSRTIPKVLAVDVDGEVSQWSDRVRINF